MLHMACSPRMAINSMNPSPNTLVNHWHLGLSLLYHSTRRESILNPTSIHSPTRLPLWVYAIKLLCIPTTAEECAFVIPLEADDCILIELFDLHFKCSAGSGEAGTLETGTLLLALEQWCGMLEIGFLLLVLHWVHEVGVLLLPADQVFQYVQPLLDVHTRKSSQQFKAGVTHPNLYL